MSIFDSLNEGQREAVANLDGPVLILAGAGTGKTHTVTCRIAHMLQRGVPAAEILAVTFTNKAAAEMRERIATRVSAKAAEQMTVCTFHSLCVKILRIGIERLGYKKTFAIYSGSDQVGLMRQLLVRKAGGESKMKPEAILAEISRAKNKGIKLADIQDDLIASLAVAYANELRVKNAVDFDDLLVLAEKLLREHADVREQLRRQFTRVTVDEFQDTNALQMNLVQQLVGAPYHICVVGDDDQSIYGWRGAEVANILQFEKFFPNPKIVRLEENYRSTHPVLHTANSLIRHNKGRREKVLRTTRVGGDPVRIVSMPGDDEEATYIAEEILIDKNSLKREWEDFAILFRTNTQSRKLEQALRDRKIPYRMIGAQSYYDRKEVKDMLAYAQILLAPDQDLSLLRVLNEPPRGIGQKTTLIAMDLSREKNRSVWQTLTDPDFLNDLSTKARESVSSFVAEIGAAYHRIHFLKENAGDVLQQLLGESKMNYVDWMRNNCKTEKEREQRMTSLAEFFDQLRRHCEKGKSLQDFLDFSALASDREDSDLEKKQGATLITLHASKGLEFPIVYLVGLEEGILPHSRSVLEGTKDEERRLFYVGITRAQTRLTITHCAYRNKYGERTYCPMSTFLAELDDEFLERVTYDDVMNAEASDDDLDALFKSMGLD